jgi:hypothetical protein
LAEASYCPPMRLRQADQGRGQNLCEPGIRLLAGPDKSFWGKRRVLELPEGTGRVTSTASVNKVEYPLIGPLLRPQVMAQSAGRLAQLSRWLALAHPEFFRIDFGSTRASGV